MTKDEILRHQGLIELLKQKLCIREQAAKSFLEYKNIKSINDFISLGYKDNNKLQDDFWASFEKLAV